VKMVEAGAGPLVLSTATPLNSAREMIRWRYTQLGARTIHHQQGTFYIWTGTHYVEAGLEEVRASI